MFEASVGGGIPIIRPMLQCLAANEFDEICGILNGTTNYILTQMIHNGVTFADALRQAQLNRLRGKRTPRRTSRATTPAARSAFWPTSPSATSSTPMRSPAEGISKVTLEDVANAEKLGCVIKLIGRAVRNEGRHGRTPYVAPHLIHKENLLASVEDVFNAHHGQRQRDRRRDVLRQGRGQARDRFRRCCGYARQHRACRSSPPHQLGRRFKKPAPSAGYAAERVVRPLQGRPQDARGGRCRSRA